MIVQSRLAKKRPRPERLKYITTYGKPQYTRIIGDIQRIELHRGCPHQHEYCYEPKENIDFPIPKLVRNKVQILDMNFIGRKNLEGTLKELAALRVNGKVIRYEAVCGFDFRRLTQDLVDLLKKARFEKIRLAWDGSLKDQYKLKDVVKMFLKAGFQRSDLMFFMIVNWRISKAECERKLDLLKVWRIKVADCCYDAGYKYAVPEFWTEQELREFRAKCRKHNQLVNFGIDPQV